MDDYVVTPSKVLYVFDGEGNLVGIIIVRD